MDTGPMHGVCLPVFTNTKLYSTVTETAGCEKLA